MKICKRLALCLLCGMLTLLCCVPTAYAQTGSITVTMKIEKSVSYSGSLTLYRVGKVSETGDSFVPTGKFTACGDSFGDITVNSADLAKDLADWAEKQSSLSQTTKQLTKQSGTTYAVTFDNLEVGLYLLVQKNPATGYNKVSPFLVTIPYEGEYHVDAASKTELEKEPTPTTAPTTPTSTTPGSKLPQTGQLNWPIPVLVILGMVLFAAGWALRFRKREDDAQ